MYEIIIKGIVLSLIYSVIGIIILLVSYWVLEKITPENSWHEIAHKNNISLAIVFAAFIIGISIIISGAIHG